MTDSVRVRGRLTPSSVSRQATDFILDWLPVRECDIEIAGAQALRRIEMSVQEIAAALGRRLPNADSVARENLANAYLAGVEAHAHARTTGIGPVPTNLGTERAELLAFVSRAMGRLLTEDEIAALLRITTSTAKALRRNMLAVFDDLPVLALKAAFIGARRDGRGSAGDIEDGYRVRFSTREKLEIAQTELDRQGFLWELLEASGSRHVLLIDQAFPITEAVPGSKS